jgi:glycerol-3-phosphate acyltransferase PlsY
MTYLVGSIPFGLILTKIAGMGDIRKIGSGNIGATNVLRSGNKTIAALTLILDFLKGYLIVILAKYLFPDSLLPFYAAFSVLVGHIFSFWLKFKGGKGIATAGGTYFALDPIVGGIALLTWLTMVKITKISSIGGLTATVAVCIFSLLFRETAFVVLSFILAALIFFAHRNNIVRLLKGTEK